MRRLIVVVVLVAAVFVAPGRVAADGPTDACITFVGRDGKPRSQTRLTFQPCTPCFVSVGEFQRVDAGPCSANVYMFAGRLHGRTVAERCEALNGVLGSGRFKGKVWKVCRWVSPA